MKVIMKYVLKNMWEKKGRTLLIVIAVMLSTSIFFSTQSLSKNLENIYLNVIRKDFGSADISISSGSSQKSQLFEMDEINKIKSDYESVTGVFYGTGFYKHKKENLQVKLCGYKSCSDLDDVNPVVIKEGKKSSYTLGNKDIIISTKTAEQYNLHINDKMKIRISGEEKEFTIISIAQADRMFRDTGSNIPAIVSQKMLNECYRSESKVNTILVGLKEDQKVDKEIDRLSKLYEDQEVSELLTENTAKAYTDRITVSFYLMSIAVFFISIFLIYSSFKVISIERMPIIGLFRSIGSTKKMTNLMMLIEAVACAVIGGLIGCAAGVGMLYVMLYFSSDGAEFTMEYSFVWMLISFGFSILIALVSVLIPMLASNKYPISVLIKSQKEDGKVAKFSPVLFGIKLLLLAGVLIGVKLVPDNIILYYGTGACVALIVLLILVVYDVVKLLSIIVKPLITLIFRHEGIIAVKNLNESTTTINNVRLLTISMTVFLMINVFGDSLITSIIDFFGDSRYEIEITGENIDDDYLEELKQVDNVEAVYPMYRKSNVKIDGKNSTIPTLCSVNKDQYLDFYKFNYDDGDKQKIIDKLADGNNIIVSSTLKTSLSLKKNDTLSLKMKDDKAVKFKIIGFYDTLESTALIDNKVMKDNIGDTYYSSCLVKGTKHAEDDTTMMKEELAVTSGDKDVQIKTLDEIKDASIESNRQIVSIMQLFSLITLLIAVFGIVNNIIVSYMEKRRIFAVQRSIGMSKFQLVKIALVEALLTGIIGSVLGIAGGNGLLYIAPKIMMSLGLRLVMHITGIQILVCVGGSVLITILTSIRSAVKTSKAQIIEAIKYE